MSLTKETPATVIAHIAGIIDAKGCFGIYSKTDKNGNVGHYSKIMVTSTKKTLPRFLLKNVGYGHMHSYWSATIEKEIWVWELFPNDQRNFINTVFPFLKLKLEQAYIVSEFLELAGSDLSMDAKKQKKARLAQKCKDLKRSTVFPLVLHGTGKFPQ